MSWHNAHLIVHAFVGAGSHKAIIPPAVVPAIVPHISVDTLLGLTIKAKYSSTELGPGSIPLVARNNDSGYLVPHFSIPMNNALLPVTIALGGSKVLFGSSQVLINAGGAQQCGCCCFPVVPVSLNMACNDPCNYPGDIVQAPNTIEVGMTLGDIIAGLYSAGIDFVVSFGFGKLAGKFSGAVINALARRAAQQFFFELAADLGVEVAQRCVRDIAENMAERAGSQMVQSLLQEAAKTGMELVVDSTLTARAGTTRGGVYDGAGNLVAQGYGQEQSNDPRIFRTDGEGVRQTDLD